MTDWEEALVCDFAISDTELRGLVLMGCIPVRGVMFGGFPCVDWLGWLCAVSEGSIGGSLLC